MPSGTTRIGSVQPLRVEIKHYRCGSTPEHLVMFYTTDTCGLIRNVVMFYTTDTCGLIRKLQLNPSKCKELRTCFKRSPPSYAPVISDGLEFEQVSTAKILGVAFRQDLKWNDHIDNITKRIKESWS